MLWRPLIVSTRLAANNVQECLGRILASNLLREEHSLTTRVSFHEVRQIVDIAVDDNPQIIGLVML